MFSPGFGHALQAISAITLIALCYVRFLVWFDTVFLPWIEARKDTD
jgi:hypothetical protein